MHTAQYTNPENLLFITAAGAIPAAITIGKMIAEPENVSALTAVTNNMIQTFLLFFSCRYQTAHMRTAGMAMLARMAFPS